MKLKSKSILFLALFIFAIGVSNSKAENFSPNTVNSTEKVIGGYLPHYRIDKITPEVFNYLTHLYYFSVGPNANGELGRIDGLGGFTTVDKIMTIGRDIDSLIVKRGANPTKIFLVVGGWELSDFFDEAAASADSRANLVSNIKKFCLDYKIDGVDLDWEPYKGEVDDTNYGLLVSELRAAFNGTGLQISATVNPEHYSLAGKLVDADFVQIMSYGNYIGENTQVPVTMLEHWVDEWINSGMDKTKLVIGLPAFGKSPDDNSSMIYSELVSFFTILPDKDWVEHDGKTYYFNNINTINQKTQFMMNNDLGGIMMWELGQDIEISNEKSLIRNVHQTVSTVLSAENKILVDNSVKLYPNPAVDKVHVNFEIKESSEMNFFITDISGKVLYQETETRPAGKHQIKLNCEKFARGFYLINIYDGKSSKQISFIKK